MPEIQLREPTFTYSVCGSFNRNKEKRPQFKETGKSRCIYQNGIDKACFQHDMVYGGSKSLPRRTDYD